MGPGTLSSVRHDLESLPGRANAWPPPSLFFADRPVRASHPFFPRTRILAPGKSLSTRLAQCVAPKHRKQESIANIQNNRATLPHISFMLAHFFKIWLELQRITSPSNKRQ
jgi:hypothetical protein